MNLNIRNKVGIPRYKVIYLGDKRAKIAQKYVENYKYSEELVNEMTLIQMEILKLSRK